MRRASSADSATAAVDSEAPPGSGWPITAQSRGTPTTRNIPSSSTGRRKILCAAEAAAVLRMALARLSAVMTVGRLYTNGTDGDSNWLSSMVRLGINSVGIGKVVD